MGEESSDPRHPEVRAYQETHGRPDAWSWRKTYAAGDVAWHYGKRYRATRAPGPDAPGNSDAWEEVA